MSIGWIRKGDSAACGGIVAEGLDSQMHRDLPAAYQGARMACRKNCVIAEGNPTVTMANGRSMVTHGQRTSGGCPLISTLNGIDGWGNAGQTIAESFFENAGGQWIAVESPTPHAQIFDEQPQMQSPTAVGIPYFIETADGRTYAGRMGAEGMLPRVATEGPGDITVRWGDAALSRMQGESA